MCSTVCTYVLYVVSSPHLAYYVLYTYNEVVMMKLTISVVISTVHEVGREQGVLPISAGCSQYCT